MINVTICSRYRLKWSFKIILCRNKEPAVLFGKYKLYLKVQYRALWFFLGYNHATFHGVLTNETTTKDHAVQENKDPSYVWYIKGMSVHIFIVDIVVSIKTVVHRWRQNPTNITIHCCVVFHCRKTVIFVWWFAEHLRSSINCFSNF